MDLPTLDLQSFAKKILELLGVEGSAELELRKLADGSIRIIRRKDSD